MKKNIWEILGIEQTNSRRAVKRAYAARLKVCHPEDDPRGFQELRAAYEEALLYEEYDEENKLCFEEEAQSTISSDSSDPGYQICDKEPQLASQEIEIAALFQKFKDYLECDDSSAALKLLKKETDSEEFWFGNLPELLNRKIISYLLELDNLPDPLIEELWVLLEWDHRLSFLDDDDYAMVNEFYQRLEELTERKLKVIFSELSTDLEQLMSHQALRLFYQRIENANIPFDSDVLQDMCFDFLTEDDGHPDEVFKALATKLELDPPKECYYKDPSRMALYTQRWSSSLINFYYYKKPVRFQKLRDFLSLKSSGYFIFLSLIVLIRIVNCDSSDYNNVDQVYANFSAGLLQENAIQALSESQTQVDVPTLIKFSKSSKIGSVPGSTPLIFYTREKAYRFLKMLLDSGENPNLATATGWTPLHYAVSLGDLEAARILIAGGADPFQGGEANAPIALARAFQRTDFVDLFLDTTSNGVEEPEGAKGPISNE